MRTPHLFATLLLICACGRDTRSPDGGDANAATDRRDSISATSPAPTRVASIPGFLTPESVRYDPAQDVYFVSNVNGNPAQKDGNGSISKVNPDTRAVTTFAESGKNGVTLYAPKGMAIIGSTLWVADIDAVRGFDMRTGAMINIVDLRPLGAVFLNDVVRGGDGALYVTDTGVRVAADGTMAHPGPDRIFRIDRDQKATVALEGAGLDGPNGIAFDATRDRFLLAPLMGSAVSTWRVGEPHPDSLASGPGQFDGVEVLSTGNILVSSWADSSVYVIQNGAMRKLVSGVVSPADIGIDTKRHRLLIPSMNANAIEIWQLAGS